jgi:uncharacterized phiE125 gp8 family phage protein
MHTKQLTDTVSPCTAAELQSWLELPETDAKLAPMLITATDAITAYLRRAILPTDFRCTITSLHDQNWRTANFNGYPFIELPYADLREVDSVTVDDTALLESEYETDADTLPARLHIYGKAWNHKLVVAYVAGMAANAAATPQAIKTAILMTAAYIFEHRGMCEAGDAVRESGAARACLRYRIESL